MKVKSIDGPEVVQLEAESVADAVWLKRLLQYPEASLTLFLGKREFHLIRTQDAKRVKLIDGPGDMISDPEAE